MARYSNRAAYVATLNQNTTGTAGTVTTAAQPNITSVGTLSGLTVSGTISGSVSGSAGSVAGADVSGEVGFAAVANSVAGGNVSGTVSSATSATSATTAGSTTSSATFNDSGSGVASGTTFNGGTARTISYNTVGAPSTTGSGASGTWGINVSGSAGSAGSATTAGTVTTAAQPNITSTGTLTSLTVNGTMNAGTMQSTTITTGSSATAGTITGDYTLTSGSTLNATYADLAEKYTADKDYEPGTVVVFNGEAELSTTGQHGSHCVAGIITTNPAQVYNAECTAGEDEFVVELALIGRVPCKVIGPISKGDIIVTSDQAGFGCAADPETVKPGTIIGKSLGSFNDGLDGVVEVLVGRC